MTTPQAPRADAGAGRRSGLLSVSDARKRVVLDDIAQGSLPHPLYYLLLAVSAGIAALGLIGNSAAVVIGAMLVSPLMTPIFGIAVSLSRGDLALLRPALLAEFGGVALILAFSFLIGLLPFALEITPEMLARTKPTLIDLLVAVLAGLAGGLAMIDERTSPMLPGVAIATALTPPLATSGLSLAFGFYDGAWGAFLLFFANFLAILAVSAGTFIAAGFVTREQLGTRADWARRFSATAIGLLAVTALLTRQLVIMISDWRTRNTIVQTITRQLDHEPGTALADVAYRQLSNGPLNVLATITTPRVLLPETVKKIQDVLDTALGVSVALFVRCSITKEVAAAGSVELLPSVDLDGHFVEPHPSTEVRIAETAEQVLRQLVSTTRAFDVRDVELIDMPTGPVVVAWVEGARAPIPLQVAAAQRLIREKLGDASVTLLVRSVSTDDVTAKGRILLGDAHFAVLTPEQQTLQAELEDATRTALARLPGTSVDAVDAAPRGDAWVVRADTTSPRTPTPRDVGEVEALLGKVAKAKVSLLLWSSADLIVTDERVESVPNYIKREVEARGMPIIDAATAAMGPAEGTAPAGDTAPPDAPQPAAGE